MSATDILIDNLMRVLDAAKVKVSNIKPSEWAEQNRVMTSAESKFRGPFSYDVTPYTREIVDCMAPDHPARVVAVMKGAQLGFSVGILEAAIGWIIAENPGNILFLTGHADLTEEAINKIDMMIDSCGIRHLIKPTAQRSRRAKTGDTNTKKEFAGGSLVSGSANNHKLLRQRSVRNIFIDDFDAAKTDSKEAGSTRKMIMQRAAAYYDEMKVYFISTPEVRPSNIEEVYLLGDQRKYHIPCPCCGEFINLEWSVPIEDNPKDMGGITWRVDDMDKLISGSVGYICQKCGGFFDDSKKTDWNLQGKWIPTAEPFTEGHYSYLLSALYAPHGMFDWEHYVNDYIEANPPGKRRNEKLHQTFVNLCLGEPYEPAGENLDATELQKNIRRYEVGVIPERLSEADGNGKIVMITMGVDLNGKEDDARLDYEIIGWSESGSSYSIDHGSIGTFVPREGNKNPDRERWTYRHGSAMSVWPELEKILLQTFEVDTGRKMKIFITGLDVGYQTAHAYQFMENTNGNVVGMKGKDDGKFVRADLDSASFKMSRERNDLVLVESNLVKDRLAEKIGLTWNPRVSEVQPKGFMNFPTPSNGKYLYTNFFSHFEAEKKVLDRDGKYRWLKKNDVVQNHLWDCRLYGSVVRDVLVFRLCRRAKITNGSWSDYCDLILNR